MGLLAPSAHSVVVASNDLIGDGLTDVTDILQREIDRLADRGGVLALPPGIFRMSRPLKLRSGVSLIGAGRHYEATSSGNRFTGTWLRNTTLECHSVQNCTLRNFGIDCGEKVETVAISIGSDNRPATKGLVFEQLSVFGAELGVRWGLGNRLTPLEQCDDISFRDCTFHSCRNGFVLNATNGSDYSAVERITFDALRGVAFDLQNAGFMKIENCAAGTIGDAIMFRIRGSSPDPLRIIGCQNEPSGLFLDAEGPNDQRTIILQANVINLPIKARGILRFVSSANYLNSNIELQGYVRWRSTEDVWDVAGDIHMPQVTGAVHFHATMFKDAGGLIGRYVVKNTRIDGQDPAESELVVKAGIYSPRATPGIAYQKGAVVSLAGVAYELLASGRVDVEALSPEDRRALLRPLGPAAHTVRMRPAVQ